MFTSLMSTMISRRQAYVLPCGKVVKARRVETYDSTRGAVPAGAVPLGADSTSWVLFK